MQSRDRLAYHEKRRTRRKERRWKLGRIINTNSLLLSIHIRAQHGYMHRTHDAHGFARILIISLHSPLIAFARGRREDGEIPGRGLRDAGRENLGLQDWGLNGTRIKSDARGFSRILITNLHHPLDSLARGTESTEERQRQRLAL
ncbi:hypothetical protein A7E75_12350 [Syntrophotalea acetylenica]|uniref:Uncharacterized protein n=1 Tax=Syntrophotalea acetylenica TaxID=29542 RepID=A0A1L3GIF1_SYNAC|nr:hypothetical protein A7E75_12350 [Syntrophotalea acetylenica]